MRRRTHELALASVLSALAAVLLCLGGIVPLATYAAPLLASMVLVAAREECSPGLAWGCWLVSAALGLLLSPDKEAALLHAFLGYYPLLNTRNATMSPWCRWTVGRRSLPIMWTRVRKWVCRRN